MKGFSLIEVLISLTMLSLTMLVISQQMLKIQFFIQQKIYQSLAIGQLLSLSQRLQVNDDRFYQLNEISNWNCQNKQLFQEGIGTVNFKDKKCRIEICWSNKIKQCLDIES